MEHELVSRGGNVCFKTQRKNYYYFGAFFQYNSINIQKTKCPMNKPVDFLVNDD